MNDIERPDGSVGRSQLIEAALDCLALQGLANTTVRTIATQAGVSGGLVRHHFGSKDRLLVMAYRHMNEFWLERVRRSVDLTDPRTDQDLARALKAYFPSDADDTRRMKIIVAYWSMVSTNSEIASIQAETYAAFLEFFQRLLSPHVTSAAEANDIAIGLIGLSDGLWLECCLNPDRLTHERAFEITSDFVRAKLQSLK